MVFDGHNRDCLPSTIGVAHSESTSPDIYAGKIPFGTLFPGAERMLNYGKVGCGRHINAGLNLQNPVVL